MARWLDSNRCWGESTIEALEPMTEALEPIVEALEATSEALRVNV